MKFSVRSLTKKLADTVEATRAARQDITDVRAKIAELQHQVGLAADHPLPRADVSVRIRELVKLQGDLWIRRYGHQLIFEDTSLGSAKIASADSVRLPGYGADLMTFPALCAGDPARATALLEALVSRVEYQPGPPAADRQTIVARLTRELEALEAEEETAVDEMNRAGVPIAHRPEVAERRELAARAAELDEQRIDNRRQRQAAIDDRPRARMVNV